MGFSGFFWGFIVCFVPILNSITLILLLTNACHMTYEGEIN